VDPITLITAALPLVLKFAPHLLSIFAGPTAGTAAGQVLDAAKSTFGTIEHDKIEQQIEQDKTLLERFQAELDARTKETQAFLADVQSARLMQVAAIQQGGAIQWVPVIIAAIIFVVFIVVAYFVLDGRVSRTDTNAGLIVGAVISAFTTAYGFFLGSSRSSQVKDQNTAALASQMAVTNASTNAKLVSAATAAAANGRMFK
jgi:hypothetical protein